MTLRLRRLPRTRRRGGRGRDEVLSRRVTVMAAEFAALRERVTQLEGVERLTPSLLRRMTAQVDAIVAPHVAPLLAQVSEVQSRLDALTTSRGAREAADVALVVAIVNAAPGLFFTAGELWAHRLVAPALAEALAAVDVTGAPELGHALSRLKGVPLAGFVLMRGRRGRTGWSWTVRALQARQ